MQVTHIEDRVTHAVIGGGKAQSFAMSDSAEFFGILSNALYSDKILAVVREVLCNAWDAHIESGRTDTPVKITLDQDGKLTIRDYGTGIDKSDIVIVYGTYGNSTKKLDGKQTGGFGLGSKSPFAYVDHFEVTSFHNKEMTIYTMSKSSGEIAGKPSIIEVVSAPTQETGLAVSLRVERVDMARFGEVIRTIAKFGEMNVIYNDVPLETIPFSQAKQGFLMTKNTSGISGADRFQIFVRYGQVVYPVENNDKYNSQYNDIVKFLERIAGQNSWRSSYEKSWNVIFQAKPNTISVTPSRESLSMTDHTISNLTELFDAFLAQKQAIIEPECYKIMQQCNASLWLKSSPSNLLTSHNSIVGIRELSDKITERDVIVDMKDTTPDYLKHGYPEFSGFAEKDMSDRIRCLIEGQFGNRGKVQSYRAEYIKTKKQNSSIRWKLNSDWFHRVLVKPLLQKMEPVEGLNPQKLMAYAQHVTRVKKKDRWGHEAVREEVLGIVEARYLSKRNLEEYMPFLRNAIILAFSKRDIDKRLLYFPCIRHWFKDTNNFLTYLVSRNTAKIEIARKFFEEQGFYIIDLTKAQKWEHTTAAEPHKTYVVRKTRKQGLPILHSIWVKDRYDRMQIQPQLVREVEDLTRINDPEFIVKVGGQNLENSDFRRFGVQDRIDIMELYGSRGGIVVNVNQEERFHKMGKPSLKEWLYAQMKNELLTNQSIRAGLALSLGKLKKEDRHLLGFYKTNFITTILQIEDFQKEFGVLNPITKKEDKILLRLWENLSQNMYLNRDQAILDMIDIAWKIPINPKLKALANKFIKSEAIDLVHSDQILRMYKAEPNPSKKQVMKELLLYALER